MKFTDFKSLEYEKNKLKNVVDTISPLIDFTNKGMDVSIEDVEFNGIDGEIFTTINGKNYKGAVHIAEIKKEYPVSNYKYHVFNCQKLKRMRYDGRAYRYKIASRMNGTFWMLATDKDGNSNGGSYEKLDICQFCLKLYNKKYKPVYQVDNFELETYSSQKIDNLELFIESQIDATAIPKKYHNEWDNISRKEKEKVNYICSLCNVNLINYKKYLHTHHVNADIGNNQRSNLKVLCIQLIL